MHVMALALGGCLSGTPSYGVTEDTGGHITYILGAMHALAERGDVETAEIVTRLFNAPELGPELDRIHSCGHEPLGRKLFITRIDSGHRAYLSKEDLARDIPAFTAALIAQLRQRERLPDIIHAHFADAAKVASDVRDALGIPFIYTAHSLGHDKAATCADARAGLRGRIAQENAAIGAADVIVGSSRDECERQLMAYPAAREERIHRVRPGIDQTQASAADIDAARAHRSHRFFATPIAPSCWRLHGRWRRRTYPVSCARSGTIHDCARKPIWCILPGLRQSIERGEPEQIAVMRELVDAVDAADLHGVAAYPRTHTQAQVRGLYALARESGGVFVNPALTEPFGLTILEAAVHGLPVVATRHGGPADIVEEIGHGQLVDPSDGADIASAIDGLLNDEVRWRQASRNARSRINEVRWSGYAAGLAHIAKDIVGRSEGNGSVPPIPSARPGSTLLLCDIDNTLTGNRAAAMRFADVVNGRKDVVFGVATGRSLIEARRLVREWGLPQPQVLVSSVGSEIHWNQGGMLVRDEAYSAMIAEGWNGDAVAKVCKEFADITSQAGVDQRAFKRSYFAQDAQVCERIGEALRSAGLRANIVHSHSHLLDILPVKAGKGAAMRHVASKLAIDPCNIVAAGDSGNDIDMLSDCRNAIVVANHEPSLRSLPAETTYFASEPNADGVLQGLAEYYGRIELDRTLEEAA